MLTKKKSTFRIYAFLATLSYLTGAIIFSPLDLQFDPQGPLAWWGAIFIIGLFGLFVWTLASLPFVSNLDESEYGLPGAVRWVACGLFSGLLVGLIQEKLIAGLSERSFFRTIFESFGGLVVFTLVFWLIFRRNIWTVPSAPGHKFGRFWAGLILFSGLVILAGGFILTSTLSSPNATLLVALGFWLSGVGLVLIASAMFLDEQRFARRRRLGWGGGGLILAGVILTVLGVFLR